MNSGSCSGVWSGRSVVRAPSNVFILLFFSIKKELVAETLTPEPERRERQSLVLASLVLERRERRSLELKRRERRSLGLR